MLRGEHVVVLRPSTSHDESGDRVVTWEREEVDNVLVNSGQTSDVTDSARPAGTSVAYSLAFPKTYGSSLRGCRVVVRPAGGEDEAAHTYAVIGDPRPLDDVMCPTPWWMLAEVVRVDG